MFSRRSFIRRIFISLGAASIGSAYLSSCNRKPQERSIKGSIIGASSASGHILRDKVLPEPEVTEQHKIVIVGGGIAGLSAGRYLAKNKVEDFILLELDSEAGGNSVSGKNEVSAYPWGAHYLPITNLDNKDLLNFLKESEIISHFDSNGIPYYNDFHLCHDPEERLYIHGHWQNGIIPSVGVPEADMKQIKAFLQLMENYKLKKGSDGKFAFDIPVDHSSTDEEYLKLDKMTMTEFMAKNNFTSAYLNWYVNYACRDDYGTDINNTSAWAGIHYFASRRGKALNAEPSAVLTWPEGNGFLVNKLKSGFEDRIRSKSVVYAIQVIDDEVAVDYVDVKTNSLKRIRAEKCILATPQFVTKRILKEPSVRNEESYSKFSYAPWMTANLTVDHVNERRGRPLSWDNVFYNSKSLGYINANHQDIGKHDEKRIFTFYYPLTDKDPKEERTMAYTKSHKDWTDLIMEDLVKVYPDIHDKVKNLDVWVWGHGMIRPVPGFISGEERKSFQRSWKNKIFFAHSDLSGISIFEEAFYHGLRTAKELLQSNERN